MIYKLEFLVIKVLVVDDHAIVRQGYVRLINSDPELEVCGEAVLEKKAMNY
jgi:DNA-binding NarL/FixJ family response regulator